MNIIMNPPYDGSLHLKILNSVTKTFPEAKIVNLSPISQLQRYIMFGSEFSLKDTNFSVDDIFSIEDASKIFNINIRQALGIWTFFNKKTNWNALSEKLFEHKDLIQKIYKKVKKNPLSKYLTKNPANKYFLKFTEGVSTYGNGKITAATFRYIPLDYKAATTFNGKGHLLYLNFNNEKELKSAFSCYGLNFFRWYSWKGLLCMTKYDFLPLLDFTKKWTDEMLYEFFELTEDEIKIIEDEISIIK